jgi:monoamine oxidase
VRSYSFPQAKELICELGGEWVGRDHSKMLELIKVLGLRKQTHKFGFMFWNGSSTRSAPKKWPAGGWPFQSVSFAQFKAFGRSLHRFPPYGRMEMDRLDWWTQLKHLGFSEQDLLLRDLMDSTDFGESIRMTSAYAAATEYLSGNRTDEMDFKIRGGNSLLVNALVADIQKHAAKIHTSATVTAVRQTRSRVTVTVAGVATPIIADHCVCAIPAPSLGAIQWTPRLPEDQQSAAAQLQYARIVKTVVLYSRRFWQPIRGDGFSAFTGRVSDFCFDSTFRQAGERGILCSYAIGDKADDVAGEPDPRNVMKWITEDMKAVARPRRGLRAMPLGVVRFPWQRDPYTGGAYALYRPGQWFTIRPILQRPHQRVQFAGEHLAEWQGFMEGAVDSGIAAASNL